MKYIFLELRNLSTFDIMTSVKVRVEGRTHYDTHIQRAGGQGEDEGGSLDNSVV
jgi:hypothetical protein